LVEYQNQDRRLSAAILGYRQELLARGLTSAQIDAATAGRFVTEVAVAAPAPTPGDERLVSAAALSSAAEPLAWEVKELRVQLGEQVQAGQVLTLLANHQSLYVEGRGFKQEAALLERAAQNGWPVQAAFAEDEAAAWPPLGQTLRIRHLANTVDPVSRTFAFYLPLTNQSRTYERDGRIPRLAVPPGAAGAAEGAGRGAERRDRSAGRGRGAGRGGGVRLPPERRRVRAEAGPPDRTGPG
jgi:hypothetical protein